MVPGTRVFAFLRMKNSRLRINKSWYKFYEVFLNRPLPIACCLLPALILILLTNSCSSNSSEKDSSVRTAGQSLYETYCVSCHGTDGKLCVLGAKDLSVSTMSNEQIMEIISNGKSTMTPFGATMTKDEIRQVAAYVQTFKK